jgi:hypothetical protein
VASALALPLEHAGTTVGVLALYRNQKDAFAAHELVSLLPLCSALAPLVAENASDLAILSASVLADRPVLVKSSLNRELRRIGGHI